MPVICSESVLQGQDAALYVKPAGTAFCLLDYSDFPAGAGQITVPPSSDYRIGDPIRFAAAGAANLDSGLTVGQTYYVVARPVEQIIIISDSEGGTPVTLAGDGGTSEADRIATFDAPTGGSGYVDGTYEGIPLQGGTGSGAVADITVAAGAVSAVTLVDGGKDYTVADELTCSNLYLGGAGSGWSVTVATVDAGPFQVDTPGSANHIEISFDEYQAACKVTTFTLSTTRDKIETTSLPCGVGGNGGKYAPFKTYESGYADGTGTMEVFLTANSASVTNRLAQNTLLKNQAGSWIKFYWSQVSNLAGTAPDDLMSQYFEGPVSLEGFDSTVNTTDADTLTINFSVSGLPTHIFGTSMN